MNVHFEVNNATQYATVYEEGTDRPVGTLERRRVYDKGPAWRLYATDGTQLARIWSTASLARMVAHMYSARV